MKLFVFLPNPAMERLLSRKIGLWIATAALVVASAWWMPSARAAEVAKKFAFQGAVTNLSDGTYDMEIVITGGSTGFSASVSSVPVTNGVFSLVFTDSNLVPSVFFGTTDPTIVAQVKVKQAGTSTVIDTFSGIPLTTVPSAFVAKTALSLDASATVAASKITGLSGVTAGYATQALGIHSAVTVPAAQVSGVLAPASLASGTPTSGQVPTWNSGTVQWTTPSGGGSGLPQTGGTMTGALGAPSVHVSGAIQSGSYSPNTVLVADASKNIVSSSVTSSELDSLLGVTGNIAGKVNAFSAAQAQYLSSITNNVQTQLNNKIAYPLTAPAAGEVLTSDGTNLSWQPPSLGSLSGVTAGYATQALGLTSLASVPASQITGILPKIVLTGANPSASGQVLKWDGSNLGWASDNTASSDAAKLDKAGGTMTGSLGVPNIYVSGAIQGDSYLPNKVLVADASSNIVTSSVSSSELNALSGVTSGVQTQLNNKIAHPLTAPTSGQYLKYNGSAIQWSTPPGGGGDLMADGSVPMTGALQADSGVKFGSTGNTIAKVLKASAASWTESTWDKASDAQQAGGYMAIYCSTGTATFSGVAVGDIVVANPILSSGTFGSLPFVSATVVATTTASSVSIRVCVSNNATPSGVSGTMNMAAYSIN